MRIRDGFGIYGELEKLLKESPEPLTCVDLYDHPEIQEHATTINRVSDYLGHMYRRGLLGRVVAPKSPNSQARYAYYWKEPKRKQRAAVAASASSPQPDLAVTARSTTPTRLLDRPSIKITEDGSIVLIELPQLTITIQTR